MSRANGEGSIYQRKDGKYVAAWVEHGRRKVAYGRTKTEARDKLRAALRRIEDGQVSMDSRMRFAEYAKHWRAEVLPNARDRRGRELGAGTRKIYEDVLALHVEPVLADLPLSAISESDVERVLSAMARKGHSGSYQKQAHKVMARMFRDARKMRLLAVVPMSDVPAPAESPKAKVVPDAEQIRELMKAAPDQRMRTFVAGLAYTGLRISELLGAKWSDLDEDMTALRVMGKGSRPRTVPVAPALKAELTAWRKAQAKEQLAALWWADEGWLLSSEVGTRWEPHNARKRFRPMAEKVLPGMTPHSLRHSTATLLLEERIPMRVVAELLGHSSTRITESTYSHVTARLVTETTDALQRRLSKV